MMKIYELFDFPIKTKIDRRVYLKDIIPRLDLPANKRQWIEKTISLIHLKGVLTEATTNIWAYADDDYFYKEIDVFCISLKDIANVAFVNEQLHKVFPNPIVILYQYGDKYAISTAPKRLNKAEKGKTVIEEIQMSDFFSLDDNHLALLAKHTDAHANLKEYYEFFNLMVAAEGLIKLTGTCPGAIDNNIKIKADTIKSLLRKKKELELLYKEADNMSSQMEIHMQIKEVEKLIEKERE